ncbi:hypothetical protein [Marisediminicola sp. LYQ85]|uniref:hypothetical protein n=1 Tax=Marisediminicola sp. LYQ85 TaxID=3391062 RepID=UPI003982EC65
MLLLALAVAGAAAAVLVFRSAPRLTVVVWVVTLCFVPIWVGFSAGIFYSAITFVTLLCIAAASTRGFRWSAVDTALLVFLAVVMLAFAVGGITLGHVLITVMDWLVPYVWGRLVLSRVSPRFVTSTIAIATVAVAAMALGEFLSGLNIFVLVPWGNGGYTLWSPLQPRGGVLRAEGAFGHSISLGSSLAIGSVFILTARWHLALRVCALIVVAAAVVVTFSRIGLVALALALVLCLLFLRTDMSGRTRVVFSVLAVAGALVATPLLSAVFGQAGDEAEGSALYRFELFSLVGQMSPVGLSDGYTVAPDGAVRVGQFESIDSALILTGLRLGWVPLVILLAVLVALLAIVVSRSANPALIAIAAQVPGLATVALITQLPYFFWFVAGLGVSLYILNHDAGRGSSEEPPGRLDHDTEGISWSSRKTV